MTVVAIQRFRDGELTSADEATLSVVNSVGSIVLGTTVIAPTSAGIYSYDGTNFDPGSYTATWVFTTAGLPTDTISRAFTVDAAIGLSEGVTLMELERLVARRVGPYRRVRVGTGSTVNTLIAPRLQASLELGDYEQSFLLRRALTYTDALVSNFNADDRVRLAATYAAATGSLTVDRAYAVAPVDGDAVEIHALDPDEELRPAVLDGLARCFFWDTIDIASTSMATSVNISAVAPWLTQVNAIREVLFAYPTQFLKPSRLQWWEPFRSGKDLWLRTQGIGIGTLKLNVLRPASSLVNGELSLSGPNDDLDVVYIDRDYAAWAGVLELWKTIPETLQPLATQNLRPSREDAATEFTKKSLTIVQQVPEFRQVDYGRTDITQIGNLAEPVT